MENSNFLVNPICNVNKLSHLGGGSSMELFKKTPTHICIQSYTHTEDCHGGHFLFLIGFSNHDNSSLW